jgi:hypothetical protein
VTEEGKKPYATEVELGHAERRVLEVTLTDAGGSSAWLWIAGGALVIAGGVTGGYFALKPHDTTAAAPAGKLGTIYLNAWSLGR